MSSISIDIDNNIDPRTLINTIDSYDHDVPKKIQDLCKQSSLSKKETSILKEYVAARDTLVIWGEITKKINIISLKLANVDFSSLESIHETAREFSLWEDEYLSKIANIDFLALVNFRLSSIESIRRLSGLKKLHLYGNGSFIDITVLEKMTKLEEVFLQNIDLSPQYLTDLQTALPNCKVVIQ